MAHKTLIGGTSYEVSGGRTLIDGTAYGIAKGRTLVGGTGYDVAFAKTIISFFLRSTASPEYQYQAEKGMTWSEWCESEYNTGGFFISGDKVMKNSREYIINGTHDTTPVAPSDVINNGQVYDYLR